MATFLSLAGVLRAQTSEPDCARRFAQQRVISNGADQASSAFAADVDGDGDTDVLSACLGDDRISWYENLDGLGNFSNQRLITTAADEVQKVFAADLDGDGDMDALSASRGDDKVAWYENTDGLGTFGVQRIITLDADDAVSVFAADLDGDGDSDVLSASAGDDKIAWYANTDGLGAFGPQQVISITADAAMAVFAADLDGDGDADVLSASLNDDKIAWYENLDGRGTFGPEHVISTASDAAVSVFASDLDGDLDLDVLAVSSGTLMAGDGQIEWYENVDGLGTFGARQVVAANLIALRDVYAADLDGDGDHDITSAALLDDHVVWYENTNGTGSFVRQQVLTRRANGSRSVVAADLDGDRDLDILVAAVGRNLIAWYENETDCNGNGINDGCDVADGFSTDCNHNRTPDECEPDCNGSGRPDDCDITDGASGDGNGNGLPDECELRACARRFSASQILRTAGRGAASVWGADLDGDGDVDVISASAGDDAIVWQENTDGRATFGSPQTITAAVADVNSIFAADVDGDGDLDVLAGSPTAGEISWYENTDGFGHFGSAQVITNGALDVRSVFVADVDGDGDKDVLSASYEDDKIAWYENTDGFGAFGPQRVITTEADGANAVFAADLDGDGDTDVLSADLGDSMIQWYQNIDGLGAFGPKRAIAAVIDGAAFVYAADVDGDSDIDVLTPSGHRKGLAWYENSGGFGSLRGQLQFSSDSPDARAVVTADFDSDGDTDVLAAFAGGDKIAWYENVDSFGRFGPRQVITNGADGAHSVFAADLDGDGDVDALSASSGDGEIAWYRNEADCNGNGVNDGCDLADGGSADCNDNGVPDECDIAGGRSADCNDDGVLDECEVDSDLDGIVDACDVCPNSQLGDTLVIGDCDTGVAEFIFDDGCTMADELGACDLDRRNHGDRVACVTSLARSWKLEGVITGREYGRIAACAASRSKPHERGVR